MQTYWDFTEQERAEMTREQVQNLLDAELMTKGVLKVVAPKLEEVPSVSVPQTQTFYRIEHKDSRYSYSSDLSTFAFSKSETAARFLNEMPQKVHTHGEITFVEPLENLRIVPVQCLTHADYIKIKAELDAADAVRRRNATLENEYHKASKKMNEVLQGVWDDWANCRETRDQHRALLNTFEEYVRIAGDEAIAVTFLRKAYKDNQIAEAYKWFGKTAPTSIVQAAIEEATSTA